MAQSLRRAAVDPPGGFLLTAGAAEADGQEVTSFVVSRAQAASQKTPA
jgi:hypothetical protein